MTLVEVVERLDELDVDSVICARRPWSAAAEAMITELDDNKGVPMRVKDAGFSYFLEVHVAREALGAFKERKPSVDEKLRLLLFYAENDAYPEWVFES